MMFTFTFQNFDRIRDNKKGTGDWAYLIWSYSSVIAQIRTYYTTNQFISCSIQQKLLTIFCGFDSFHSIQWPLLHQIIFCNFNDTQCFLFNYLALSTLKVLINHHIQPFLLVDILLPPPFWEIAVVSSVPYSLSISFSGPIALLVFISIHQTGYSSDNTVFISPHEGSDLLILLASSTPSFSSSNQTKPQTKPNQ